MLEINGNANRNTHTHTHMHNSDQLYRINELPFRISLTALQAQVVALKPQKLV